MQEYSAPPFVKIWAISLHDKLQERIIGNVYIDITTDNLVVTLHNKLGTPFRWTQYNIASEIARGLDSQMVTENIVKQYKKFIENQFFCKKDVDKYSTTCYN